MEDGASLLRAGQPGTVASASHAWILGRRHRPIRRHHLSVHVASCETIAYPLHIISTLYCACVSFVFYHVHPVRVYHIRVRMCLTCVCVCGVCVCVWCLCVLCVCVCVWRVYRVRVRTVFVLSLIHI